MSDPLWDRWRADQAAKLAAAQAARPQRTFSTGASSNPEYVTAALRAECDAVRAAAEGTRNDTLNRAAFSLGTLVAAGHLDEETVTVHLEQAAQAAGLDESEISGTVRSGLRASADKPREIPATREPDVQRVGKESSPEDPTTSLRRARVTWASEIEPEPVVWAWEDDETGRIPAGSLSVAAGREGTGKSSFGIWLAAQITRGTLPGSYSGQPRSVFYVAVEDSWKHTLVPRLLAAGADLDRVGRFDVLSVEGDEVTLSLPHDNYLLEQEMRKHSIALVVIDPLMSVIGERIDTHREREVRSALDPLAKMADRTGSVLLGIAHFNKGNGTDAASLITGSGAFKNVPRSVFGFARDETDDNGGRVMSQVKNSLGRDDLPSLSYLIETACIDTRTGIATTGKFAFTGTSDRSVADLLRENRADPDDQDERRELDTWLLQYLTDEGGSANARDVILEGKANGFSENAIKKARCRIKATSERHGFGKGSAVVWTIGSRIGAIGTTDKTPAPMAPMAAPMPDLDPEERTKSAKSAGNESLHPSLPSPDACRECGKVPTDKAGLGVSHRCVSCELRDAS